MRVWRDGIGHRTNRGAVVASAKTGQRDLPGGETDPGPPYQQCPKDPVKEPFPQAPRHPPADNPKANVNALALFYGERVKAQFRRSGVDDPLSARGSNPLRIDDMHRLISTSVKWVYGFGGKNNMGIRFRVFF